MRSGRTKKLLDELSKSFILGTQNLDRGDFKELEKDAETIQNPIAKAAFVAKVMEASASVALDDRGFLFISDIAENLGEEKAELMGRVLTSVYQAVPQGLQAKDANVGFDDGWGFITSLRKEIAKLDPTASDFQAKFDAIEKKYVDTAARGVISATLFKQPEQSQAEAVDPAVTRMIRPDGRLADVPNEQVEEAKAAGYRVQ
jgi:hypothetical protein